MKAVFIIQNVIMFTVLVQADIETGYYWVDYYGGKIPANAVKIDSTSVQYVGQVYTPKYGFTPAAVQSIIPHAIFHYEDKVLVGNENIKVLCTQFKEQIQWIKTNLTHYRSVPDLLIGGVGPNGYQYIGKKYIDGKAIIGKIDGSTFQVPTAGNAVHSLHVLVYNNKCEHYHNKCITYLSKVQCDCLECFSVDVE